MKTVGDTQQFNLVGKEEGVTSYAVVVLKNLRWPGSFTVTNVIIKIKNNLFFKRIKLMLIYMLAMV